MKAKAFLFIIIIMLAFPRLAYAYDITPTCDECQQKVTESWRSHARSCTVYRGGLEWEELQSGGGRSGGGASGGGSADYAIQDQMIKDIFTKFGNDIFSWPSDNSVQDRIARQNAIDKWIDDQNKAYEEKINALTKKREKGEALGAKMGSISGGKLKFKTTGTDFFGTGNPSEVQFKLLGTDSYPTSHFTATEKLLGTAYFMGTALDATTKGKEDWEKARFFGEQADKVSHGQATNIKCSFKALPDVPGSPDPKKAAVAAQKLKDLLSDFNLNVKLIQENNAKLKDIDAQIKKAESEKEAAQIKFYEAKRIAATAKADAKQKADEDANAALLLLNKANNKLSNVNQDKNDIGVEIDKTERKIEDIQNEMRKPQ